MYTAFHAEIAEERMLLGECFLAIRRLWLQYELLEMLPFLENFTERLDSIQVSFLIRVVIRDLRFVVDGAVDEDLKRIEWFQAFARLGLIKHAGREGASLGH